MTDEANFYGQLTDYASTYYDKKLALIEKERQANALLYGEKAAQAKAELDIAKAAATKWDMENAGALSMISNTGKLLDSTMGMFKKESSEYKALMKLKEVAYAAEMGMNVAKAASALSVALAQNAANASVATTGAAASVAAQGSVPIAGFALAAAMAAFMASILAASGIAWGGGSAGTSAPALPASTVLGAEAGTGSESISNSWEKLMDIDLLQYKELRGIHESMKDLNSNISGLISSIFRSGGIGAASSGTAFGTVSPKPGTVWEDTAKSMFGVGGFIPQAIGSFMNKMYDIAINIPIIGAITKVLTSWATSVFGGKKTTSLTGTGIVTGGASLGELIGGGGMSAREYADITQKTSGGWFGKDKTYSWTQYAELDAQVSATIDAVFQNIAVAMNEAGKILLDDTTAILNYVLKGEKIVLTGTAEEMSKQFSDYMSKTADVAASALFTELMDVYQKAGEGAFEAVMRLATNFATVGNIFEMTNQQISGTKFEMIGFVEAMVDMAGGLDKLTEAASTYYDKFFTDAEKQARLQGQLAGALGDMGMALPDARQGYRDLVEGLDLNTTAGQEAYVALLGFAEAADQYYSAVEDATGGTDKLTEALKRQSETVAKWLSDLNKSTLAPVMSAQAQEAAYAAARSAAMAPGATEANTSAFLTTASDYLKFARAYSGDYASIYQSVTGDVRALAEFINAALGIPVDSGLENFPTVHGTGGLTNGPTISGEMGGEWNVPTYEPQRSRFLESAPPQFWENLRGGGMSQGSGGDITVRVPVYLDGKVVADVVAKHVPRNANLSDAIRRVN
jgi:hypothetical protein